MVKGATVAAYIILSNYLYCSDPGSYSPKMLSQYDEKYCADSWTISATVLCVLGVVVYSL